MTPPSPGRPVYDHESWLADPEADDEFDAERDLWESRD